MSVLLNQIFSVLTTPPGNVTYHLVLIFSMVSALQVAFGHWRSSAFPQARRTLWGLGLLLSAQFLLFVFSGLAWQGLINPQASLPPLDRAVALFSLLWIIWLWAFPEPHRLADAAAILLSLLLGAAAMLGLLNWAPQATHIPYNATLDDRLWQSASISLILLGGLLFLVRQPSGYGNGLALLAIVLMGHLGHWVLSEAGSYSAVTRLAYLAAYPLLITLPQRFPAPMAPPRPPPEKQEAPRLPRTERRRYSADPKTFHALLALAAESSAAKVNQAISRAIAQGMLADLCFVIYLTDNKNQMIIAAGYDLIREEALEGGSISKQAVPMLANALQRGRPLRLPASSTSVDIKGLGELLGLSSPGHLLSAPIVTQEKEVLGGVILLSPYSNRLWSAEDQAFLMNITQSLVPVIQRSQRVNKIEQQGEQVRQSLEALHRQNEELKQRNEELSLQIEGIRKQAEEAQALSAAQEQARQTIAQLQQEVEALRRTKGGGAAEQERERASALEEVARLQEQLAKANAKILALEKAGAAPQKPNEQAEVIASISQELRQPMSSIIGYTDLLLGESVGILGALQRKFVERIKAAAERTGSLVDDLIHVTTPQSGTATSTPQPVDLNVIIDNAMAYTGSQIREKNISLQLDLPRKATRVNADREALQQILIHLLQNAGAASPVEGTIRLRVHTTKEAGQDYVLIQVTDSGGGIPAEDLPRVFTRLYRADNVLIQGVGDTGVGLSIAKSLTEAQHGRIWVESEPGAGATFSVLLPIARETQDHPSGGR